jgi:F-type H+-transporting ATPase subunit epsilon
MSPSSMQLEVLLPSEVFASEDAVSRIVAETSAGSHGLLPHRRDCVAVLVPGVLVFSMASGGEVFMAVDEGVLVKTGLRVVVAVRRAIRGVDLATLRELVIRQFIHQDAQALQLRSAMALAEGGFMRGLARYEKA